MSLTLKCCSISVSHTSIGADVVILGGDLNMHPLDLGNRLLKTYIGLRDSYLETAKFNVGIDKLLHTMQDLRSCNPCYALDVWCVNCICYII